MVRKPIGEEADEPAVVPAKRQRMTVDEQLDDVGRKGKKMSVAQRLQNHAQLSPRSQDDPEETESVIRKEIALGKYDKATIRIIAQFLDNIGLTSSVETLVEETGFTIETTSGARVRANILKGNYDAAIQILETSNDHITEETAKHGSYIVKCFKLADLVRKGRYFDALFTMQKMIRGVILDHSEHFDYFDTFFKDVLLGNCRYQNIDQVAERQSQLAFLEEILPSDFILPQNRLKTILNKVHGAAADEKAPKLLRDEPSNSVKTIPWRQTQLWDHHKFEIFCVKFSRNGKMMASGGKSNSITLWKCAKSKLTRIGEMAPINEGDIAYMEFCQQNKYLLICGGQMARYNLTIFDIATRSVFRMLRVNNTHDDIIDIGSFFSCGSFLTDTYNRTRVVAGNEFGAMKVFDLSRGEHEPAIRQQAGFRIRCLHGMRSGDSFIAVDTHNRVRFFSFANNTTENLEGTTICKEEVTIIHMTVHPSERLVLTTTELNLRLWDIRTHNLIRIFSGACQREEFSRYQIHSSFGGVHQNFIATGSIGKETDESLRENDKTKRKHGRVVIWSVQDSRPRYSLVGHRGHVNAVAWNPADPTMLVSCGADATIRVWSLDRSETADYSEIVPRRIPRHLKQQKKSSSSMVQCDMMEPSTSKNGGGTYELCTNMKEMLSTKSEFESDLKQEQEWLNQAARPDWILDNND